MLKITDYAQRLIDDLDDVDFIERVKIQQRNWIGRSDRRGGRLSARPPATTLTVYTTRPDTLFGATYMVISPEHPLHREVDGPDPEHGTRSTPTSEEAARKSDFERTELNKEKTGVRLEGVKAINPVNGKRDPDLHLRLRPGDLRHRRRSWPCRRTIPATGSSPRSSACRSSRWSRAATWQKEAFTDMDDRRHGQLRLPQRPDRGGGQDRRSSTGWRRRASASAKVNYKLRDWVFSRQRYWGEPIPHGPLREVRLGARCRKSELPLRLPEVESYEPTDDGESPLSPDDRLGQHHLPALRRPRQARDGHHAPVGRFLLVLPALYGSPQRQGAGLARRRSKYWSPVDWYNGGMEHTTLHLLYSRFWHKFLYDIGVVPDQGALCTSAPATA